MNDMSNGPSLSTVPRAIPMSQKIVLLPKLSSSVENVLPSPTSEVVTAVFQEKPELIINEILPPVKSKSRTKGDIVGFSDTDDENDSNDALDCDESIDISDIKANVKFLPTTVEGVCKRLRTCEQNSCDKGNMSTKTKLCSFWMSYYDRRL